jgi:diaminopimelate epimerase
MQLNFVKQHGAGNDYVYIDGIEQPLPAGQEQLRVWARALSDRHFGVGGDGMILVLPSDTADFRMRMFNADGTEGRMCGNGVRCVAKYLWEAGHAEKRQLAVETLAGTMHCELLEECPRASVRVRMGEPGLRRGSLPMTGDPSAQATNISFELAEGVELVGRGVAVGNAHVVFFVDDITEVPLEQWGPVVEWDSRFPDRTNVEFVEVLAPQRLRMRVWERGSGVTLACGTGACASLVAAQLELGLPRKAEVMLDGGQLTIEWRKEDNNLYMTGPAEAVFSGTIDMERLLDSHRRRQQNSR